MNSDTAWTLENLWGGSPSTEDKTEGGKGQGAHVSSQVQDLVSTIDLLNDKGLFRQQGQNELGVEKHPHPYLSTSASVAKLLRMYRRTTLAMMDLSRPSEMASSLVDAPVRQQGPKKNDPSALPAFPSLMRKGTTSATSTLRSPASPVIPAPNRVAIFTMWSDSAIKKIYSENKTGELSKAEDNLAVNATPLESIEIQNYELAELIIFDGRQIWNGTIQSNDLSTGIDVIMAYKTLSTTNIMARETDVEQRIKALFRPRQSVPTQADLQIECNGQPVFNAEKLPDIHQTIEATRLATPPPRDTQGMGACDLSTTLAKLFITLMKRESLIDRLVTDLLGDYAVLQNCSINAAADAKRLVIKKKTEDAIQYQKFAEILNAKKRKIVELQQRIDILEGRTESLAESRATPKRSRIRAKGEPSSNKADGSDTEDLSN